MSLGWARSRKDTLELKSCDHVGKFGVLICVKNCGIKGFETGCKNDGTHVQGHILLFLIVFNGSGGTDFFAVPAFILGELDTLGRIDAVFQGNGLIVFHIDGFTFDKACVVGVRDFLGAFFRAETTGDTFFSVNVPWFFLEQNLKIACFTLDVNNFT